MEAEDTDRFENPEDTGETLDEDEDENGDEPDEPADDSEAADPS